MFMRLSRLHTVLVIAGIFLVASAAPLAAPASPPSEESAAATDAMTPYRTMATEVLKAFKADDMPTAQAKAKELQKAWDSGQKDLNSRSHDAWKAVDKAMDVFIKPIIKKAELDAATVQAAYKDFIAKLDAAAKL